VAYRDEVLADSPVAYWKLDEVSGTEAVDEVSNANPGIYTGPCVLAATPLADGKSVTFNDVDTWVDIGDVAALDFGTGDFTVEGWFSSTATANWGIVASKRASTSVGAAGWYIGVNGSTNFIFSICDGVAQVTLDTTSAAAYLNGSPHHIVGVRRAGTPEIYVNGVLLQSGTNNSYNVDNGDSIRIGRTGEASTHWKGRLDEVAVYNTAISLTRIITHYNAGKMGGGIYDDRWRVRPSQFVSHISTLGTQRSVYPEDARDGGQSDAVADNRSRT